VTSSRIRIGGYCLALWGLVVTAASGAEGWGIGPLMDELAQHSSGRARFVEKRYLAVLDGPLVSSGELSFIAPDKLEKSTLRPEPELIRLDGDSVVIERGRQHLAFDLGDHPELGALIESLRATLSGNRRALDRHYMVTLSGTSEKWSLVLVPRDERVKTVIARVVLSGKAGQVLELEYDQADGDRSLMTIEPIQTP
jgi:hypothetical protein